MLLRRFFNILRLFLAFWLPVSAAGCAGLLSTGESSAPVSLTILFFNDLHGHLAPFEIRGEKGPEDVGGIARMAALIRDIRAENSRKHVRTLVLVAGDILQGTPMSTLFRGEPDIECLNAMGVDAMTVGNHDFDFGLENFRRLQARAAFPFLSANLFEKQSGRPLCRPALTVPLRGDLAVTVIGVTTEELMTVSMADNVAELRVSGSLSSVRPEYDRARSRGPVVLLSHSEHRFDRAIAEALPDLAAVIGGHDHVLFSPCRQVGPVPIFQAFEKGLYLGRIDLRIDPESRKAALINYAYIPVRAGVAPEPRISALVDAYQGRLGGRFKEVIGHADLLLDGERRRIRFEETALGNFVADIMVEHTGAQIAMINAGAIRASIQQGPVTVEDVLKAVPFANELVVMELTGEEIEKALQRSVSGSRGDEDGGFLQVSGMTFEVRGRSVSNIRVGQNRQPLNPRAAYAVAIPDFLATGGDPYTFLKGKPNIKTGLPLGQLIVDTIRRRGRIAAAEEGRILRFE